MGTFKMSLIFEPFSIRFILVPLFLSFHSSDSPLGPPVVQEDGGINGSVPNFSSASSPIITSSYTWQEG